jgi:hypothetical protein
VQATTATRPSGSPGQTLQISTPDGQVTLSLDGKLPPNWPAAFPVPTGATPAGSGSLVGSNQGVMVGVFSTTGSASDAFSFYTTDSGLTTSDAKSVGVGSAYVGSLKFTAPFTGSVTVVSHDGNTYIVVVIKSPSAGLSGSG